MADETLRLDAVFRDGTKWPHPFFSERARDVAHYNALFENDRDLVLAWSNAMRKRKNKTFNTEFVAYPAPELAARTLSSFLFGENATISSEDAPTRESIDALIEANHLHALNQEAAITAAVEGEMFYRIDWDATLSEFAIISAHGGADVVPWFRHGRLVECAFIRNVTAAVDAEAGVNNTVFRHVEIRTRGRITHRLYQGTTDNLGRLVGLDALPDADDLGVDDAGVLETGVDDILVRHVPFWRTSKSPHGISIFRGKDGLVEAIHTLYTQDQHDAEMAKKRIAVAKTYLNRTEKGTPIFDRNSDLFELSDDAAGSVGGDQKPVHAIEFTDSTVQGQRIAQRLDEFLLACGIAPQSAGRDTAGATESGTARRLAQSLTLATVATAARYFTPALRDVIALALEVTQRQGLGGKVAIGGDITVELEDGVPDDPREMASVIAALRGAGALSVRESVRWVHPEWTDDQIDAEVALIEEEQGLAVPDVFRNPPVDEAGPNEPVGAAGPNQE